jgi:hypothetical protein
VDLKYNKATDSQHTVKLESELIYAVWRTGAARAGGTAGFEVRTSFVGNGAKIKLKGKSENGKKLGKIDGEVRNNKYVGEFDIRDDVDMDDLVYFEVKLPANGLTGESNRIPTAPAVDVTNMKWSVKEARRGDIVTLSADVGGCRDGTEAKVIIFEYDQDKVHDRIIELPATVSNNKLEVKWEYEYHEDTDEIPTDEELQKYGKGYNSPEYFFVIEIDGQRFGQNQESKLLLFKDYIDIVLVTQSGTPIPNEDYVLYMPDGSQRQGKLDREGRAVERDVPPGEIRVEFPNL